MSADGAALIAPRAEPDRRERRQRHPHRREEMSAAAAHDRVAGTGRVAGGSHRDPEDDDPACDDRDHERRSHERGTRMTHVTKLLSLGHVGRKAHTGFEPACE